MKVFSGFSRILLHTETADGTVVPVWEEVQPEDVAVLKDIMISRNDVNTILQYNRIPITAENPPDFTDLSEMMEVVMRTSTNTPIVVNCQLGGGRSTLASILLVLIRQWLESQAVAPSAPGPVSGGEIAPPMKRRPRTSYQVINSELFLSAMMTYCTTDMGFFRRPVARFPEGIGCQEFGG